MQKNRAITWVIFVRHEKILDRKNMENTGFRRAPRFGIKIVLEKKSTMTVFYIGARMGVSDAKKSCDPDGDFFTAWKNTGPKKYGKYRFRRAPRFAKIRKKNTMT
jgi:predicted hydrocarbon binding protein